ncbi:MAG: ParA family protein [Betaproteobacteria bacterium]|nr:ParA family protein [Betaproteobacteria bacterium]
MAVIAVFNQKGGVGKTTSTLNLLGALARIGQRPIGIDLDPQAHLSGILCGAPQHAEDSAYEFFARGKPLWSLLRPTRSATEVVGAHIEMSRLDSQLGKSLNAITRLGAALQRRPEPERQILIDCPPQLGVLSLNAMFACDLLIVPVSADFLAMQGARSIDHALNALEPVLKRRLPRRYLLTRFDTRRRMCATIAEQLVAEFGAADVFETRIAENVSLAESPWMKMDVFEHAPASRGAVNYEALLGELLSSGLVN